MGERGGLARPWGCSQDAARGSTPGKGGEGGRGAEVKGKGSDVYGSVSDAWSKSGLRLVGFQCKTTGFEKFRDPQILRNQWKSMIPRWCPGRHGV